MEDSLQEQIENYVAGTMPHNDRRDFELKIAADESLRTQITQLTTLRDVLIHQKVRKHVLLARQAIEKPKSNRFLYVIGTFAAAASIFFILLSTPISTHTTEFNYRGGNVATNTDTQKRLENFQKAQKYVQANVHLTEAIAILEQIKTDSNVNQSFQEQAKWLLTIGYLSKNDVQNAEKNFESINCNDADCPFSTWEKCKVRWQIFLKKIS